MENQTELPGYFEFLSNRANDAIINREAYFRGANRLSNWELAINLCLVIITTAAGTKLLSGSSPQVTSACEGCSAYSIPTETIAGVLSLLAALLTAVRPQLNLRERSKSHHAAAVLWTKLGNDIQEILACSRLNPPAKDQAVKTIDELVKRWNQIVDSSPPLSDQDYKRSASLRALPDRVASSHRKSSNPPSSSRSQ